jgi:hypothetical protein
MSRPTAAVRKRRIKLLKTCAVKAVEIRSLTGENTGKLEIVHAGRKALTIPQSEFQALCSEGLIVKSGSSWQSSREGRTCLRRMLSEVDEFQSQHRVLSNRQIRQNGQKCFHQVNDNESPLSRLRFRIGKDGAAYLDDCCFQAGERLRVDFTKANLMQQVSSNWNICLGVRSGKRNGKEEVSDAALSARLRTQKALVAVGPEFSGVLVDICCFLKGLSLVEQERRWPPRSAKLMLRTGLSILARHYGLQQ